MSANEGAAMVPITLISGFLGSGKTTLLSEMLQNKGGLKVGMVVNDVAKINIDSKLVRERTTGGGIEGDCVELQNGCACCNASDELFQSIQQLLRLAHRRGKAYDRIVIEMSGVAEPKNVRREFLEAADSGHAVMKQCELQNMITVVDSPNFIEQYQSRDDIIDRPDLVKDETDESEIDNERKVVDLLVEQVECADTLVLNKMDRCTADEGEKLAALVATINPTARVLKCEWGKVPVETVFGPPERPSWVSKADDEDDLRAAVRAAKEVSNKRKEPDGGHAGHGQGHGHGHEAHEHGHGEAHEHDHEHKDGVCPYEAQGHGGGHGDAHGHGHETDSYRQDTTSASQRFGISSFVYSRRRPFHPQRLMQVVMHLPVKVDPKSGQVVDRWSFPGSSEANEQLDTTDAAVMRAIIRSKGFVWVANQHRSAQYWSHAGHYFELRALGLWWAATALSSWPDQGSADGAEVAKIVGDFARPEDPAAEWGDRRQEIVFIGIKMKRAAIEGLMDKCLLTDEELAAYKKQVESSKDVVRVDWARSPPAPTSA